MILLGLFRFIGFISGILLAILAIGLWLRTRSRQEEATLQSLRDRNLELKSENTHLKRQMSELQSELTEARREPGRKNPKT
jgi:cell division protein FtsB